MLRTSWWMIYWLIPKSLFDASVLDPGKMSSENRRVILAAIRARKWKQSFVVETWKWTNAFGKSSSTRSFISCAIASIMASKNPEQRVRQNKSPGAGHDHDCGDADRRSQGGDNLISDDGGGIDLARVKDAAVRRGITLGGGSGPRRRCPGAWLLIFQSEVSQRVP